MQVRFIQRARTTFVCLEYDVVGLGETHDEDQVDQEEPQEVLLDHPVDHDDEGTHNSKGPAMEAGG